MMYFYIKYKFNLNSKSCLVRNFQKSTVNEIKFDSPFLIFLQLLGPGDLLIYTNLLLVNSVARMGGLWFPRGFSSSPSAANEQLWKRNSFTKIRAISSAIYRLFG